MNVFLLNRDAELSAREMALLDPRRARKQLLECCQILASAEHILLGKTYITKADGTPYSPTHIHHPCVRSCANYKSQFRLTTLVAISLAEVYADHQCSRTLVSWLMWNQQYPFKTEIEKYVVVRRGLPHEYVRDLDEYVELSRPYFLGKLEKEPVP